MAQLLSTSISGSLTNSGSVIITGSAGTLYPVSITNNVNNQSELINTNANSGNTASTDVVCFNNIGSAATYQGVYNVDLGINSSGYTYPFIGAGSDAYLFNSGSNSSSFYIGNIDNAGGVLRLFGGGLSTGSGISINATSITASLPISGTINNSNSASVAQTASFLYLSTTYVTTASRAITSSFALTTPTASQGVSAWASLTQGRAAGQITSSTYNMTGITRLGIGSYGFRFNNAMATLPYVVTFCGSSGSTGTNATCSVGFPYNMGASAFTMSTFLATSPLVLVDFTTASIIVQSY